MQNELNDHDQYPVSRTRRYRFVAYVVGFCLSGSLSLVVLVSLGILADTGVTATYIDALMGLATAVSLAYMTGSVIDYNGGVLNAIRGKRKTNVIVAPLTEATEAKG